MDTQVLRRTVLVLVGVTLALIGVVAMQHTEARNFRSTLYERCLERLEFDRLANLSRAVQVREFESFARQETANRFIDDELRVQRVSSWRALAEAQRATIAGRVMTDCERYRP